MCLADSLTGTPGHRRAPTQAAGQAARQALQRAGRSRGSLPRGRGGRPRGRPEGQLAGRQDTWPGVAQPARLSGAQARGSTDPPASLPPGYRARPPACRPPCPPGLHPAGGGLGRSKARRETAPARCRRGRRYPPSGATPAALGRGARQHWALLRQLMPPAM